MRANILLKMKKWMIFFPSINIKDVACHYWLSWVYAPDTISACQYIGAKRSQANKQEEIIELRKKQFVSDYDWPPIQFSWNNYFPDLKLTTINYHIILTFGKHKESLDGLFLIEIPSKLDLKLRSVDCRVKNWTIEHFQHQ